MGERIINRNPYLYGPGPVKRTPKGFMTFYSRMPPVQGFAMAAAHGVVLGLVGSFTFKFFVGDPTIASIEQYYKENRKSRWLMFVCCLVFKSLLTWQYSLSQLLAKAL